MEHMIDREVYYRVKETRNTIERLNTQIELALEPPIKDLSMLHEVTEFIEQSMTYENAHLRKKVKMAILLRVFVPECFLFRGKKLKGGKHAITSAISKELGLSRSNFKDLREHLFSLYKTYGKFADSVDETYEKVAERYGLPKTAKFSKNNEY